MDIYERVAPLLRLVDPEFAHRLALRALAHGFVSGPETAPEPVLKQRLFGLEFPNPIGLAAGFDKNGEAFAGALRLGFGFVEIGSVTPLPQKGNPRPRLFRLAEDRAIVNRLGFNNQGMARVARRLAKRERGAGIVGVNIGSNAGSADPVADYVNGLVYLGPLADYLAINISSPNTPGLRDLQGRDPLERLLDALMNARAKLGHARLPILVKVAPDLDDAARAAVAEVALAYRVDGLIVSNTTTGHRGALKSRHRNEQGGLSGAPLFGPSTACLADFHRLTGGALPLIGVGGVAGAGDAYAKLRAGAALVQLYTAMVFEGPGLAARINAGLPALLARDGFGSLADAVGAAA